MSTFEVFKRGLFRREYRGSQKRVLEGETEENPVNSWWWEDLQYILVDILLT